MTGVRNPNGIARHGSYAFFPGSGPENRCCCDCASMREDRRKHFCGVYQQITGNKGTAIDRLSPACRHFVQAKQRYEVSK